MERTAVDWQRLKEELRAAAPGLGIDKLGFASAEPFAELKDVLLRHRALGRESGFEDPDLAKRTDPSLSLKQPRSLIAIAVAYPSKMNNPPRSEPGAYRGILARSAWGEDYHQVLRERLAKLTAWIEEKVADARIVSMVDTGALVDRAVAERAGIGWSGKNCATITPEYGSWVYLGELITNVPFPPDTPISEQCGDCTICIDACPTGALVGPGQLHAGSCISFLTQTKESVSDEMKKKIGNRLYGCDTCQIVCPHNKGKHWDHHEQLRPHPEQAKPLLLPLLSLSNREFKEKFGSSAAAWRGKKPIQRNAVIALGNFKDHTAVPELVRLLEEDPREAIRESCAWALGQIGGDEAERALKQAAGREEQLPELAAAIQRALKRLRTDLEQKGARS